MTFAALIALVLVGFIVARFIAIPALSVRPADLGVKNGQLKACPNTPNCVSTQADVSDRTHYINSIVMNVPVETAKDLLVRIVEEMDNAKMIVNEQTYMHVEFRSNFWAFVDDTEFYLDSDANEIHFRSAARLGRSDLGVNRKRMETIRSRYKELERVHNAEALQETA